MSAAAALGVTACAGVRELCGGVGEFNVAAGGDVVGVRAILVGLLGVVKVSFSLSEESLLSYVSLMLCTMFLNLFDLRNSSLIICVNTTSHCSSSISEVRTIWTCSAISSFMYCVSFSVTMSDTYL